MDEILQFFPHLSPGQIQQLEVMLKEYPEWNSKINVVSRRDIDNLAVHHILHSLAIARFTTPAPGVTFMDLGAGGGFPSIPLAMLWPECHFVLVDRIAKKLRVAEAVAEAAGIANVSFQHGDSSECRQKFNYVVSRAVMPLPDLIKAARPHIGGKNGGTLPNGLICLKGGDLTDEIKECKNRNIVTADIHSIFPLPFFENKYVVYTAL